MLLPRLALALTTAGPLASAQVSVRIVDNSPGSGAAFPTIQAAIDSSQAGDVVLVRSGMGYPGFTIDRPIQILGDGPFRPIVHSSVRVDGVAGRVGETVILRGLNFVPSPLLPTEALVPSITVRDTSSLVRLEDLDLSQPQGRVTPDGIDWTVQSIDVVDSSQVRLVSSTVGTTEFVAGTLLAEPRSALTLTSSNVDVYDSQLIGARGRDAALSPLTLLPEPTTAGSPGILVDGFSSLLRVTASDAVGGAGGAGLKTSSAGCIAPADGGDGLSLVGGLSHSVVASPGSLKGGAAGEPAAPNPEGFECPTLANPGQPLSQGPATGLGFVSVDAPFPTSSAPSVVREGEAFTVTVEGLEAFSPTFLALGLGPAPEFAPLLPQGLQVEVDPLLFVPLVAQLGAPSTVTLGAVGNLLESSQALPFYHQIVTIPPSVGAPILGSYGTAVLVDAGL